jgi:trimeric autotransporter adhesin
MSIHAPVARALHAATRSNSSAIALTALCSSLLLAGCGGGGGRGSGNTPLPPAGSIQFETTAVTVDEVTGGTAANIVVSRNGGSARAVSVTVAVTGTASAGSDYTLSSTTVSFADGDTAAKTLRVTIPDDAEAEADETLTMTLTVPTGGATVGANASATLTITDNDAPAAPEIGVTASTKQLSFSWDSVPGATGYRLMENRDGASAFVPVGDALAAGVTSVTLDVAVHQLDWVNARYRVDACNGERCSSSDPVSAAAQMLNAIGYLKASNTGERDQLGFAIAVSADGGTLAVSALGEDSAAGGVNGDQGDNAESGANSGAVYVFARNAQGQWLQQAYVKASNPGPGDQFGFALALDDDGRTLAVSARDEDSAATGVNGDQSVSDNADFDAGAVYVFTRDAQGQWSQQAYVKASNTDAKDNFGYALSLSGDGSTLAVSATLEDSAATGVNGGQGNSSIALDLNAGAVYVFMRDEQAQWSQQAYLKASNTGKGDNFGDAVAISADGSTLAVGATREDSAAIAVNGPQGDSDLTVNSGAVYVFMRDEQAQWSQQAYVKPSNTNSSDHFGYALALSADGRTLAVSAVNEDSDATGVDGNQEDGDPNVVLTGAAYVFTRDELERWLQDSYVKPSNTDARDHFGDSIALSGDGRTLAVGATNEDSGDTGVDGDEGNVSDIFNSGAAYLY